MGLGTVVTLLFFLMGRHSGPFCEGRVRDRDLESQVSLFSELAVLGCHPVHSPPSSSRSIPSCSHCPDAPALTASSSFESQSLGLGPGIQQVTNECLPGIQQVLNECTSGDQRLQETEAGLGP